MVRASIKALAMTLFLAGFASSAWAVEPSEMLDNPGLEQRARAISKELRCLVCQNQSIDESDAELARDLRVIIRQRLVAGDSDQEVIGFIVARYGDWVLLDPPFKPLTWVLWLGPLGIVAIAGLMYRGVFRGQGALKEGAADPLSGAERRRLDDLLKEG
jgi:cytochrome c-type biogenesis protein CcmH